MAILWCACRQTTPFWLEEFTVAEVVDMSDAPPAADSGWTIPVRELLTAAELGLRVLAGASALGREVSWAHVSELVDPTEFLQGGELLLLTGVSMPAGAQA